MPLKLTIPTFAAMRLFPLIFISLLMLSALPAAAQDRQTFKAALLAGINMSQVDGDNLAGFNKLGFNGGAKAYFMFSENFSLGMELLYVQKGSRSTITQVNPANEVKYTLSYAEVPVLFHYHDKGRAIFGAGLSYGRVLDYQLTEGGVDITNGVEPPENVDLMYVFDLVFLIKERFGINGRYSYSFFPIAHFSTSTLKNNAAFNNVVTLRAMYMF